MRPEQAHHLLNNDNCNMLDSCIKVGDFCVFKRIDNEKFLIGKIVQFSYLEGNKRDRQYSSNYVDVSKDSYEKIGAFADWYVILEDPENGLIRLEELETGIFTVGYVSMDQYYCRIESTMLTFNDSNILIQVPSMDNIFPQWRTCLTFQI